MENYNFYLIRHGLTQANLDGAYCGCKNDQPLCEQGANELYTLLDSAEYPFVDAVYTSPMQRARETANILYPDIDHTVIEDLREADFGRFDGKSIYELKGDEEFERWAAPGSKFTPEGVEPPQQFFTRGFLSILSIIESAMRSGEHNTAIITHAGIIGNAMSALCLPHKPPYDWGCDAGCGFMIATNAMLWQRGHICEAMCALPRTTEDDEYEESDYEGGEYSE